MKARDLKVETPHICYGAKQWLGEDRMGEDAFPTLALHGWLDNAATFDYLAPLLPQLNLVARGAVDVKNGVTLRSDPRLRIVSPGYMTDEQVFSFLDRIEAQTLMIVAEKGLFSDRQYLENRTQRIKNLHKIDVPGGHHVHLDDPEAVAPHILSFL